MNQNLFGQSMQSKEIRSEQPHKVTVKAGSGEAWAWEIDTSDAHMVNQDY